MSSSIDTFNCRRTLSAGGKTYSYFGFDALKDRFVEIDTLPFSIRILLENLLRCEDGKLVSAGDIEAVAAWDPQAEPSKEIAFAPSRVLLQDFTGVPAVVDLAAMRDAVAELGGDPEVINPLQPAELVIDHSVQVDEFGTPKAFAKNAELEFERNRERYQFLRWGQQAFKNFKVVPPDTGIVHQVNLEYLARVVSIEEAGGDLFAYPDTLVGTDSHTTMVNGLGVLGWGVGGIEAEAAMLGQPLSMLLPQVVGLKFTGALPEGATATDLVLTVTEILREVGVVGRFVEFFGDGLASLPLANRATISNMSPEFGATCAIFPVDSETLRYMDQTGRPTESLELVESYMRAQGLYHDEAAPEPRYSQLVELDLATVEPSLAGPRRPQDRVRLADIPRSFNEALAGLAGDDGAGPGCQTARFADEGGHTAVGVEEQARAGVKLHIDGVEHHLHHGSIVIAAITSCTNTSNPYVMVGAGLLAKKAVERGLEVQPYVKTSLAPGSKVVSDYLNKSGLQPYLDQLGFNLVGYGCTTCIGNSGPLPKEVSDAIEEGGLAVASVLSGNRNFEGRINTEVKANYLASPPLVVAYALAGRIDCNLVAEPLGQDRDGVDVYLRDLWPNEKEISDLVESSIEPEMFKKTYAEVFDGDERWNGLPVEEGQIYQWDDSSTYIKRPPFFDGIKPEPEAVGEIEGARVLALLGDSVTTDHISPAGAIKKDSPAGRYLVENGVEPSDFNSYGSRRGNHEVMMRGTFANVRLRNQLLPGSEGGVTAFMPSGEEMPIYDAAVRYRQEGTPLIVIAGKEYGSGSSRDWAAKGTRLLGVRAVIAESYERIHRSNLVGMGVLPLQFQDGESAVSLGITGRESFSIEGLNQGDVDQVTVVATATDGTSTEFKATVRIDTPRELQYYRSGGILQYVLRQLVAR